MPRSIAPRSRSTPRSSLIPRAGHARHPKGDVTMVELFDYNCGFCKRALTDMMDLMKADPTSRSCSRNSRLGEGSTQAAQVAVAVRMQDKTAAEISRIPSEAAHPPGSADKAGDGGGQGDRLDMRASRRIWRARK